jgi:hypothetical protein
MQRQVTRKAVPEQREIARPRQSGPDIGYQRCVRVISWTCSAIRASYVQGPGNVLSQPRLRTNRFDAILISWCRPVCFSCIKPLRSTYVSNFGCGSGIKTPVFFGTRPPHRMRGSQGFGPTRALLDPVTLLLDLLAVGHLVPYAALCHQRLSQRHEDRGLKALFNVA